MGRAETVTLLPLDRYASIMRIPACHFNQVAGAKAPLSGGCDGVWSQEDREALAWAMATAEQMIAHELGFWPAPKWFVDEEIRINRVRTDWWNAELATRWKYVQQFGTRSLSLVEAGAPVAYEDRDHDQYGREETAVVGDPGALYYYLSTSCADPCDVRLYFREEDGAWDPADPRWEIRPVRADVDGDNLTVTAESCMFVRPALWEVPEQPDGEWIVPFDVNNLVDAVDVYCEGVDLNLPATIYWDAACSCGGYPCTCATQGACAFVTDWERGHFCARPAAGANAYAAPSYYEPPVKVKVSYLAGYPLDERTCRMDSKLERAIVKLANVLLPEPPCGYCDAAQVLWKRDREPVDPLTPEVASMPWDEYSRGALEAWRIVKRLSRTVGGSVRG